MAAVHTGDSMQLLGIVGSVAGVCTTGAYIPQIIKIQKQGGADLSYPMLVFYLTGVLLWLVYSLILHAPEMIWANGVTSFLVVVAIVLKATHPGRTRL
jgi:MtN3 and saliva related transmembrane protein